MATLMAFVSAQELCQSVHISESNLVEIVEHGIVEPQGNSLQDWQFDMTALTIVRRAVRLHRDLEIDWSAAALAVGLLQRVEHLEQDNLRLKRLLGRFMGNEA